MNDNSWNYYVKITDNSGKFIEAIGFFKDSNLLEKIKLIKSQKTMENLIPVLNEMNIRSCSSLLADAARYRKNILN